MTADKQAEAQDKPAEEEPKQPPHRVAWRENGVGNGETGHVGKVGEWLFQVWHPGTGTYELICNLPGKTSFFGDDEDVLKLKAEEVLAWFLHDITGDTIDYATE